MADEEKQLLSFCTASVELYARSIIDPGTVNAESVQKEIQSFASKMDKSKATNVGKILFCLELQYRNAAVYERFMSARKKIEDATEAVQAATLAIGQADPLQLNVAAFQSHSSVHAELETLADSLLKYYKSCFPIRHRVRFAPIRLTLSPICSYKTEEFEINAAEEYVLLEKQRLYWKVQARDQTDPAAVSGPEILIPSLFFFIHWLPDDADTIQRLLTRVREGLCAYVASLATHLRSLAQQAQPHAMLSAAQLEVLNSLLSKVTDEPERLSKTVVCGLQGELAKYLQRAEYPDLPETEKPVIAIVSAIMSAVRTYMSMPEDVPDRSQVVFNRRLRIDGQKEKRADADKLVHVEWKMELMLNKCVTTTETTEIIPKHVDVDRIKQSEQELERKMVIQAVVDPDTDQEISLNDALKRGIVDYASGTYCDKRKGVSITIDEAIMKGFIQVEFVAVQAGEEKFKNFGVVTVTDPANDNSEEHYVVHVAIDRKTGERLEFDTAVDRKILNLESGWFWDSLENEALPISDAIDKGYLKGRKVDHPNELNDLSKSSQSEVIRMRFKKVTARVGVVMNLRNSLAQSQANGSNGSNGGE